MYEPLTVEQATPLWAWMNERQAITLRRARGQGKPWSHDPIFQQYRFCNVFRELDTVTAWIHEHIRVPYRDALALPFLLCVARVFNWPDTLQDLLGAGIWPWDAERMEAVLEARAELGDKVYTGAYMLRSERGSKHRYAVSILTQLLPQLHQWSQLMRTAPTLQTAHAWLAKFYGWGPFMAYEVVTDLRHTKWLREAPDIMTWANAGPGALRGLNRLLGRPLTAPMSQTYAVVLMQQLLALATGPDTPLGIHVVDQSPLEMRDIEHSLCEMDKYLRVWHEEGRPRARFNGV